MEPVVDVHADLRGEARKGQHLQDIEVLRRRVEDDHVAQLQLLVGGDDRLTRQVQRLVHAPEIRAVPLGAPVLVEELPQPERILAVGKLRNALLHRSSSVASSTPSQRRGRTLSAKSCKPSQPRSGSMPPITGLKVRLPVALAISTHSSGVTT